MAKRRPCAKDGCLDLERYRSGWCAEHRPKTCGVVGCENDPVCRGLCVLHYDRLKRTGEVGPAGPIEKTLSPCGTWAAYKRHLKFGEPACEPCAEAARKRSRERYLRERSRRATAAKARAAEKRALRGLPDKKQCDYCGSEFQPSTHHPATRFCSRKCQDKDNKRLRRVGRQLAGDYTRLEVFERDKWKCQLCGGKINRRAKPYDPKSPSIDHIVPLDLGGPDSRTNVQAAHLGCNIAKGVRPAGEQLRLVG